jgi:AraC-like DNA-binding protein
MNDKKEFNFSRYNDMAIQIASANTEIYFTVIVLSISRLKSLLQISQHDALINAILNPTESFLFYESIKAETQKTLKQLYTSQPENGLTDFFYRIKTETLLYDVFNQLHNRKYAKISALNKADIDKLFLVRESILSDLSHPPSLPDLAKFVGMSETKIKDLFRNVFGDSIYNHYQTARMEEAAYLLKYGDYSVSEVGYQLGFSNLSHFTRLFERYHNQKPKKYSLGG